MKADKIERNVEQVEIIEFESPYDLLLKIYVSRC